MKVYVLKGYGVGFFNRQDAVKTIRTTWSKVAQEIIENGNSFVIRTENGFQTVVIEEINILDRDDHL